MLSYHPALDPYHGAFRTLRILVAKPDQSYYRDQLRILDFYLLFPALVGAMRMPKGALKYKRAFQQRANRFWFTGDAKLVFKKMGPIQYQAFDLLFAAGLVDPQDYRQGRVTLTPEAKNTTLVMRAADANVDDQQLVSFLTSELGELSFTGRDGLKARTSFLEFRYDSP